MLGPRAQRTLERRHREGQLRVTAERHGAIDWRTRGASIRIKLAGCLRLHFGLPIHVRKNLEVNYERFRKAAGALENFQIGRDHLRTFLASCENPEKAARATARLAETEARIKDIEEGIRKLQKWITEDEQNLREK